MEAPCSCSLSVCLPGWLVERAVCRLASRHFACQTLGSGWRALCTPCNARLLARQKHAQRPAPRRSSRHFALVRLTKLCFARFACVARREARALCANCTGDGALQASSRVARRAQLNCRRGCACVAQTKLRQMLLLWCTLRALAVSSIRVSREDGRQSSRRYNRQCCVCVDGAGWQASSQAGSQRATRSHAGCCLSPATSGSECCATASQSNNASERMLQRTLARRRPREAAVGHCQWLWHCRRRLPLPPLARLLLPPRRLLLWRHNFCAASQ